MSAPTKGLTASMQVERIAQPRARALRTPCKAEDGVDVPGKGPQQAAAEPGGMGCRQMQKENAWRMVWS